MQRLLTTAAQALRLPPLDPKGVDGKISRPPRKSNTVAALEAFEKLVGVATGGIIEPASPNWRELRRAAGELPG